MVVDYFDLLNKLDDDIKNDITNFKGDKFNLFEATGMGIQEIKHSKFLANLLNPGYPHNLGNSFLKQFLEKVYDYCSPARRWKNADILAATSISKDELLQNTDKKDINVFTERALTIDEGGRLDICIETDDFLIIIENKVFTGTHDEQLRRYEDEFASSLKKKKIFIYLTPCGDLPVENGIIRNNWCVMSYESIKDIIGNLMREIRDKKIKIIMEDYKDMIDKSILNGNGGLIDACKKVYDENRDAIDLINLYI